MPTTRSSSHSSRNATVEAKRNYTAFYVLIAALLFGISLNRMNKAIMSRCRDFDIPTQTGKTFVVTGASSGLGLETSRVLAEKGGKVIMAVRSLKKCGEAREAAKISTLDTHCRLLELGSQESVRTFASDVVSEFGPVDSLVNNAGLMNVEPYQLTEDNVEMTMGVNHVGHFLLTQLLLPHMKPEGRIVWHSSVASYFTLDVHALLARYPSLANTFIGTYFKGYSGWKVYGDSKLANAQTAWELTKRLQSSENATMQSLRSYVVHPGYTSTHLQEAAHMVGYQIGNAIVGMNVRDGVQTQLLAAAGQLSPLFSKAGKVGNMLSPVAYMWGYPSVKDAGLYDEVLGYHLWEETLSQVGIDSTDDVLPASDLRKGLISRAVQKERGGHVRTLFQHFEEEV